MRALELLLGNNEHCFKEPAAIFTPKHTILVGCQAPILKPSFVVHKSRWCSGIHFAGFAAKKAIVFLAALCSTRPCKLQLANIEKTKSCLTRYLLKGKYFLASCRRERWLVRMYLLSKIWVKPFLFICNARWLSFADSSILLTLRCRENLIVRRKRSGDEMPAYICTLRFYQQFS